MCITTVSVFFSNTIVIPSPWSTVARFISLIVFLLSVVGMICIHRMYPEKHDRPSDFPRLLQEGPYALCRNPFYGLTMVNQIAIARLFLSLEGVALFIVLIPLWYALIRLEERELVACWGQQYVEYMKRVPMHIPLPRRNKKNR